jgi:hypothetical protein
MEQPKKELNPDWIYSEDLLDVKVINEQGKTKFVPAHLVTNARLMKDWGFEIVKKPKMLEAVFTETTTDPETFELNETTVAETSPAKRGRKPNQ